MKCPLCESRKAKRLCPAKAVQICPVCCGTKREVEINCPSDCIYLHSGREYESAKLARTQPLPPHTKKLWEDDFLVRYQPALIAISKLVTATRVTLPELADTDLLATIDSLLQTFQTLDKGIYYDFAPSAATQKSLYLTLKRFLDGPSDTKLVSQPRLTAAETVDCLQFLKEFSQTIALPRPKSRAFLDHLESVAGGSLETSPEEPRLILPADL